MKIARVFPRRTKATPDDALAFVNCPPSMLLPEIDEVHVSVTFTYDMKQAERLATWWCALGVPVKIGGPAIGKPSGDFVPGMYLKNGYTFTSRGCPNKCWHCSVWKREPKLVELEIKDGWIVQDDNLLACSDQHIKEVFEMLKRQPKKAVLSGGLEAKLLKPWHCTALKELKPASMYFAYDTPDDLDPLVAAGKMLRNAGFKKTDHSLACYVLIGYKGDTFEKAEQRLHQTIKAGFFPYAMLWKDDAGHEDVQWRRFQRQWCNPTIVGIKVRELLKGA